MFQSCFSACRCCPSSRRCFSALRRLSLRGNIRETCLTCPPAYFSPSRPRSFGSSHRCCNSSCSHPQTRYPRRPDWAAYFFALRRSSGGERLCLSPRSPRQCSGITLSRPRPRRRESGRTGSAFRTIPFHKAPCTARPSAFPAHPCGFRRKARIRRTSLPSRGRCCGTHCIEPDLRRSGR